MDATVLLTLAGVSGILGGIVGANKRMGFFGGFILGAVFSVVGVLIVAVSPSADDAPRPAASSALAAIAVRPAGEGWHPDPLGRFDARYFDGARWTEHVGRIQADGQRSTLTDAP